jgi:hypothetical protein
MIQLAKAQSPEKGVFPFAATRLIFVPTLPALRDCVNFIRSPPLYKNNSFPSLAFLSPISDCPPPPWYSSKRNDL